MRYLAFISFNNNILKYAYITQYENVEKRDSAFNYFKHITGTMPCVYFSPEVNDYNDAVKMFAMGKLEELKQAIKEFNIVESFKTNMD